MQEANCAINTTAKIIFANFFMFFCCLSVYYSYSLILFLVTGTICNALTPNLLQIS